MHGGGQTQLVNIRHLGHNRPANQPPTIKRVIAIGPKARAVHRNRKVDIFGFDKAVIKLVVQFVPKYTVEHVMGNRAILHDLNFAINPNGQRAARAHMKI